MFDRDDFHDFYNKKRRKINSLILWSRLSSSLDISLDVCLTLGWYPQSMGNESSLNSI